MKTWPLLLSLLVSALPAAAAGTTLKVDRARSYVDVEVKATAGSFTGRLESYAAAFTLDPAGKIKSAAMTFAFADLRTGESERDAKMIEWLGGGAPEGKFQTGIVAVAPDGQGQVTGSLVMHGQTRRVEFPVQVTLVDRLYSITGEVTIDYREWDLKVIRMMGLLKVDPLVKVKFKFTAELPPVPNDDE